MAGVELPSQQPSPPPGPGQPDQSGEPAPTPGAEHVPTKRRPPIWAWLIVASCTLLVAAIVFATVVFLMPGASRDSTAPSSEQKPAATAAPPATDAADMTPADMTPAEPAPIVLPSCETLWPERYARAKVYAEGYPSEILFDDIGDARFSERFGPAAQTALSQGTQVRGCVYVVHSENFIQTHVTELVGAAKETFVAALRADGDFTESIVNGALVFEWQKNDGAHWDYVYTTHSFIGDVWIAGYGPQPATDYVPTMTAAILEANPTLGSQ